MIPIKIQQKSFISGGLSPIEKESHNISHTKPDLNTTEKDPSTCTYPPFRPKGTKPETIRYIKDIVVTGLRFVLHPFL